MLSVQDLMLKRSLAVVWCFVLMTEISALRSEERELSQPAGPVDARLVDGDSRCSGRLEMRNDGEWRALVPTFSYGHYNLWYGEVACRQMGCGSAVSLTLNSNDTERPAWEVSFDCRGRESTLEDCKHPLSQDQLHGNDASARSLHVTCSESVKRVKGSYCSGQVEVKSDQGWVPVCEEGFDIKTQLVVCRELGCGPSRTFQKSLASEIPTFSKRFQCQGNESRLEDCINSVSESCRPFGWISCSNTKDVRLTGGKTACTGTLEGKQVSEWRPLVDTWNDMEPGHLDELCEKLGCGNFISMSRTYLSKEQTVWEMPTNCRNSNPAFCSAWDGISSHSQHDLTCSEAVRLEGSRRCQGKLKVKSGKSWVPVCSSFFTAEAALVTCTELKCGFPGDFSGRHSSFFPEEAVSTRSPVFNCAGTEQLLLDCPSTAINTTEEVLRDCLDTYMKCQARPPPPSVEVFTQPAEHSERSSIVLKGHRFAISCSVSSPYSVLSFRLVSHPYTDRQMEQIQPAVDGKAVFFFPAAEDAHRGAYHCEYNFNFSSEIFSEPKFVTITIKENKYLRLVSEQSRCVGRLELEHHGEWRPVSHRHSWSLKEASVACRQLGCGSAVSTLKKQSTEVLPTWRFYSNCDGSERALMDCGAVEKWPSSSTVEVTCSDILLQPNISFSSMMSQQQQQGALLFRGHSFTVTCSVEPQYPGGHFSLVFTGFKQTSSITKPAVGHAAQFRLEAADESHRGNYSCVYHNSIFNQNFSSESHSFSVGLQEFLNVMLDDGVLREDDREPCSGRLIVTKGDKQMMLSADSSVWDLKHASLVCRQLGCGSAISTSGVKLPKNMLMARYYSDCDGSESALLDCGTLLPCISSNAVQVVCTGH